MAGDLYGTVDLSVTFDDLDGQVSHPYQADLSDVYGIVDFFIKLYVLDEGFIEWATPTYDSAQPSTMLVGEYLLGAWGLALEGGFPEVDLGENGSAFVGLVRSLYSSVAEDMCPYAIALDESRDGLLEAASKVVETSPLTKAYASRDMVRLVDIYESELKGSVFSNPEQVNIVSEGSYELSSPPLPYSWAIPSGGDEPTGPLLLTATDPVSWAEAGTLRALVANPLRWKTPVGLTLSTEGWVDIAPPPPEPLVPDERHVRWAIYEDGTLVINGENEPSHNGHGAVAVSCDTSKWGSSGYSYRGLLDLDAEGSPPWQETYGTDGDSYYPNVIGDVTRVEFAAPTNPTHMNRWFLNAKNIVTVDSTYLDLGRCVSMDYLFAQIPAGESAVIGDVTSIPYLGGWKVSNVQSMTYAFATPMAEHNIGRWPQSTGLSLGKWRPRVSCDVSFMFMGNSGLELVWGDFGWGTEGGTGDSYNMFYGCTSLHDPSSGLKYDPERVDSSMATPGGYFQDPSLDPDDPEYTSDPIDRIGGAWGFAQTPGFLEKPVEYPLSILVRAIDGYVAVTGEFTRALRSSITDLSQIEPFLYVDADAVAEAWRTIEGDPDCARAELEGLLSSIGGDFSDAGLTFEVTGVERTEYLTYVDFTLNGTPVRTSLRLPALA